MQSLLLSEAEIIRGATAALKDLNGMLDAVATAPTMAINHFADFGADLTNTFNHKLSSVYGEDVLRTLSSVVLLQGFRAIDPGSSTQPPKAMLSLLTLREWTCVQLDDFVAGQIPPKGQIAVGQTPLNLSS